MNEEVFVKNEADGLTARIAYRLGERQQKLERMAAWERHTASGKMRPLFLTVAIAACVAALLLFSPFWRSGTSPIDELGIAAPTLTEYRAASPEMTEIAQLLEKENFDEALQKSEKALRKSDDMIKELYAVAEMWGDDEAVLYDLNLEQTANSELRWTYIYLLVKQGRNRDAKKELKRYLKTPEYCEHEADAKALLEKL